MITNPYDTTFGKMLKTTPVISALVEYIVTIGEPLNYEFTTNDDTKLVFITGKNTEENALPIWEHPIVFKDMKGNVTVATDLRKFVRVGKEEVMNITDIAKEKDVFNFLIVRTLATADITGGYYGKFKRMERTIAGSFGHWLATNIGSAIMLTVTEKLNLEIMGNAYMYSLMVNGKIEDSDVGAIIAKITSSKLSVPVNKNIVRDRVLNLKFDTRDIDELVSYIKIAVGPDKETLIDMGSVITMVNNSWYGPGGSETIIMGLEHFPTWIALLSTAGNTKSFKRTRLATTIQQIKSKIKLDEFTTKLDRYVADSRL